MLTPAQQAEPDSQAVMSSQASSLRGIVAYSLYC